MPQCCKSGILTLLTKAGEEGYINIAPILSDLSKEKLKKGQYRMLELSLANLNDYHMADEKIFIQAAESL